MTIHVGSAKKKILYFFFYLAGTASLSLSALLHDQRGAGVRHGGVTHRHTLRGLGVFKEFQGHTRCVGSVL